MRVSKADAGLHRTAMATAFNAAWELLEKKRRTSEEERRMLDMAHASRYHAAVTGTPSNHAIGDWQIARVYAALGEPGLSLRYAMASLAICRRHRLHELMGSALEGMARAYSVGGRPALATYYLQRARHHVERARLDAADREIFLGQIADTEQRIRQGSRRVPRKNG